MKNAHKTMKETSCNREYIMAQRYQLVACPICKPHRGCNRDGYSFIRNWKKYRKTQYKQ